MFEDIDESLRAIERQFLDFCQRKGCFYDIRTDEQDIQRYLLKDKSLEFELKEFLRIYLDRNDVLMKVEERPDGIMFTFTRKALHEQGSWKPLPKNPKREDYSPFANKKDAKRVRTGKTMYQKNYFKNKKLNEGQYKYPTTKHLRDQSSFPSSIGPSRSHGGVTEESVPPKIERPSNVGLTSANRTNGPGAPGESRETKSYKDRNPIPSEEQDKKMRDELSKSFGGKLEERLSTIGRTNDISKRTINTEKNVPGPAEKNPDSYFSGMNMDDTASQEAKAGIEALARDVELRPLGEFTQSDNQIGGPRVGDNPSRKNVTVKHPPDRSFDNSSPEITTTNGEDENLNVATSMGSDPLKLFESKLADALNEGSNG
jgi:hypothetical protein